MKTILIAAAAAVGLLPTQAAAKPVQYVIISFDGAHDNALWERSLKLAGETGARFTYFLSCVYLLSPETKKLYGPPGMKAGRSNVGFAASREDAVARLGHVWTARQAGHEIASHGCGHFDGKDWTGKDWQSEFDQFSTILMRAWKINGRTAPTGWAKFASHEVKGFRAPYLSTGKAMFETLEKAGFAYDASGVSRGPQAPEPGKLARFSLPMIPEGPSDRRIIAMDYNLFVRHSGGIERPGDAGTFTERTYEALAGAFDAQYAGERIPLQMGFHFTLMNGGAYWDALERFARDHCLKADVRCVSYEGWLRENAHGAQATAAGG